MVRIIRAAIYMAAGPLLLFWLPVPFLGGLVGGLGGGMLFPEDRRHGLELGIVVALALGSGGLLVGQNLAESLPLVGSFLATLVLIWYLLNCVAVPVGALVGSALARGRARAAESAGADQPGWQTLLESGLSALDRRPNVVDGEVVEGESETSFGDLARDAMRAIADEVGDDSDDAGDTEVAIEPAQTPPPDALPDLAPEAREASPSTDANRERRARGRRGRRRGRRDRSADGERGERGERPSRQGAGLERVLRDFSRSRRRSRRDEEPRPAAGGRPVTIMFTDIESSTSLTQQLGDTRAQQLLIEHNEAVRSALARYEGREVKHTGDGIMASFLSASAGIEAALAMQAVFTQREAARTDADAPLRARIGLNTGEPLAQGDDLFGSAVQLARRICDEAEPGQILVSDIVRQLCAGKTFVFTDLGRIPLKGFEDAHSLFAGQPPG